jgi:hypothetical protein
MMVIALLLGCTETIGEGAAFTLSIDVQLAPNQTGLLSELSELELIVEYSTGSESYPLSTTEPGKSAEIVGIDPLDAETVALVGYADGEVAAFGRSTALSVSKNNLDASLVLLRTDDFAWLEVPEERAFAAAASTGDGRFWISGGSSASNVLSNETGNFTLATWWSLSLTDGLELALSEVDGLLLPDLSAESGNEGNITTPGRLGHTMTHLGDGELLIVGGGIAPDSSEASSLESYLWTPDSGEPDSAGSLKRGRAHHQSVLLPSGNVVLIGGYNYTGASGLVAFNDNFELIDSSTRTSQGLTDLLTAGSLGSGATQLQDTGAMVCGGISFSSDTQTPVDVSSGCDIIGLEGSIESSAELPVGVVYSQLTQLLDGSVLLTGGMDTPRGTSMAFNSTDTFTSSDKVFLFTGGSWSEVASMSNPRARHVARRLTDGRVLVAGGATAFQGITSFQDATALPCAELYDPLEDTWTEVGVGSCDEGSATGALPQPAWDPAVASDDDYGILLIGGVSDNRPVAAGALFVGTPDL